MARQCKSFKCEVEIDDRFLMCAKHWTFVSMDTRRNIHAAAAKHGRKSLDHIKAVNLAIVEVAQASNKITNGEIAELRNSHRRAERVIATATVERLKKEFAAKEKT